MNRKTKFRFSALVGILAILLFIPFAYLATNSESQPSQPPLLDRKVFFGDPEIVCAQISPSGSHIAFLKPYHNILNVWVKKTEEPFNAAYPVTNSTRPIRNYSWSRDGKHILFAQDFGGNENYHLYATDPYASDSQTCRDLTPYGDIRAEVLYLPKSNPDILFVGLNDRDDRYHDVYCVDLATGHRTLVMQNDYQIADWIFDRTGTLRLGIQNDDDGTTQIRRVDIEGMPVLWTCSSKESVAPFRFHKDGKRLYMATDKGDDVDRSRLVLLDVQTGDVEIVEEDPEGEVDFEAPFFSLVSDELIATSYLGDRLRVYFKDADWEKDFGILSSLLPNGQISLSSTTLDEKLCVVSYRSDIEPESAYLYNRETKKVQFLYKARPYLPSEHLSCMTPFSYTARDGLTIHAYLTIPRGQKPTNLPLVVLPHGGPWARDMWGYSSYAQLLSNRGYAVLQMNFRGSTGYGKKFLNAGNKQWGDSMQNDITDGVLHLIQQGTVDPKRIAIFGGSYGGYATLAGLAFTPDVYAAGISYVGPSNLITLLNSFPPYWTSAKSMFNERLGDLQNPDDVLRLKRQSPVFSASHITAPLLVVQGANDPRVKKAESDQIVVALRDLGRKVEYIVAPDEGHGFSGLDNRMAFAVAMEKFLAQHLGGRCQDDVPEDIANKLAAITLDINTVTLASDESKEQIE